MDDKLKTQFWLAALILGCLNQHIYLWWAGVCINFIYGLLCSSYVVVEVFILPSANTLQTLLFLPLNSRLMVPNFFPFTFVKLILISSNSFYFWKWAVNEYSLHNLVLGGYQDCQLLASFFSFMKRRCMVLSFSPTPFCIFSTFDSFL